MANSLTPNPRAGRGLASRYIPAHGWRCGCNEGDAAYWLNTLTALALTGDRDARRLLPAASEHYLCCQRLTGVKP